MLEKPNLADARILECLREAYGLDAVELSFLPLGADAQTAVYQLSAEPCGEYFCKLRRGPVDEISVAVPLFLSECGIPEVIAPFWTRNRSLYTRLDGWTIILYPWMPGQDGYETDLTDTQWTEFGTAVRGIHKAALPPHLARQIPQDRFDPRWRESVREFQARVEEESYPEPVAARTAAFMRSKREQIRALVSRADLLARTLESLALPGVLCHGDLHPGNILIGVEGTLHIVDWDTLVCASKERDLMFIGSGIGGLWGGAQQASLFYRGYGPADLHPMALAYYRFERVIEDIAAFCGQLLSTDAGGADREQGLKYLIGSFLPNHDVEQAYQADAA